MKTKDLIKNSNNNFMLGLGMMLISGLGFAIMGLFVRLSGDIPSIQKTFFRNFTVFFVSFFVLWKEDHDLRRLRPTKHQAFFLLSRCAFGLLGVIANFYAVDHMPIANAQVLNKLSPFFTIIFASLFLKEKINKVQIGGIVLAFIGVAILAKPDAGMLTWDAFFPIIIGISGGLMAGAAYTCVRYLGSHGMQGSLIVCVFAAFSIIVLLPPMLLNYQPMTAQQWLYMFLIGFFAMVGQYGITFAYRFASPNQISIFDYSSVVFSTILGFLFLNQVPHLNAFIGSGVVFCAFLMMFIFNRRKAHALQNKRTE